VVVRFVPRSTGVEVNHPGGRVFILSDLFLLCEKMAPEEKSVDTPSADMWLLYPPLAGKHLKVAAVENEGWFRPIISGYRWLTIRDVDRALQVTILRKEKIVMIFASPAMRERVLSELHECIEFASAGKCLSRCPSPS
jgi:hypothetical protein